VDKSKKKSGENLKQKKIIIKENSSGNQRKKYQKRKI
jgi:hypothetical protein